MSLVSLEIKPKTTTKESLNLHPGSQTGFIFPAQANQLEVAAWSSVLSRMTKYTGSVGKQRNGLCMFTIDSGRKCDSTHTMRWLTLMKTFKETMKADDFLGNRNVGKIKLPHQKGRKCKMCMCV